MLHVTTPRLALGALAAVLLTTLACSSSSADFTPTGDGGAKDAPVSDTEALFDAGDGGCVTAVEGAACTPGVAACNQGPNPCCDGLWQCNGTTHQWQQAGLGCACQPADTGVPPTDAPPALDAGHFSCGTAKTCNGTQFCAERAPGVDGGTSALYYTCESIPAACASTPTCDCVKANVGANCTVLSCKVDAAGNVTLGCMGA
jgi:hypothetical protein